MNCECQAASKPDIRLVGIKLQSIPDCDNQFLRVNHPLIRDISVCALHGAVLKTVYVIKDYAGIMHPSLPSSGYSHRTLSLAHSLYSLKRIQSHLLATLVQKKMHVCSRSEQKHTTAGIRWWSPTQLLTGRRVA